MIISRLRVEIGDGYADELERMLEDAIFSQAVSQGFAESIKLDEETAQKNTVLCSQTTSGQTAWSAGDVMTYLVETRKPYFARPN